MATVLESFLGSLMGVRVGDALGVPVEILSTEQILEITGPAGITTFLDPQQYRTDAPTWAEELKALSAGDYTDDWQLTRAGTRSLIDCTQLDVAHLGRCYVNEMHHCRLGWGNTTIRGLTEISSWLNSPGTHGRTPGDFARFPGQAKPGVGCGNGVAMRMTPFALMMHRAYTSNGRLSPGALEPFQEMIWNVGGLTHPDPRASIGAFAIASFVAALTARNEPMQSRDDLLGLLMHIEDQVDTMETHSRCQTEAMRVLDTMSHVLNSVRTFMFTMPGIKTVDQIRSFLGTSCHTLESVPFCIAVFLRHPTDFRLALKETIEAGGDTDTNAAIVGSMVGANVGINGIPDEWRRFRPDFIEAEELGTQLWQLSEDTRLASGSSSETHASLRLAHNLPQWNFSKRPGHEHISCSDHFS